MMCTQGDVSSLLLSRLSSLWISASTDPTLHPVSVINIQNPTLGFAICRNYETSTVSHHSRYLPPVMEPYTLWVKVPIMPQINTSCCAWSHVVFLPSQAEDSQSRVLSIWQIFISYHLLCFSIYASQLHDKHRTQRKSSSPHHSPGSGLWFFGLATGKKKGPELYNPLWRQTAVA